MKNFYYLIVVLIAFSFFISCKNEEGSTHAKENQYLQPNGYLPLGSDNTWVYETWQANLANDGTYTYQGSPTNSQSAIAALKVDESNKIIEYKFGPFGNSLLGGLLGNFKKVIKKDGKYYRNAEIDFTDEGSQFNFDLNGSVFLNDDVKIGEMLYSKTDSILSDIVAPVKIKYSYKTYVTGKYDKLPAYLISAKGIDDHLAQYTDIVKVTDSLTINKVQLNVNSIRAQIDLSTISEGQTILHQSGRSIANGNLEVIGSLILPITLPIPPISIPLSGGTRDDGFLITFKTQLEGCKMQTLINIDKTFNYKYNIIADNTPIYIDTYYAKGVGKIKTVTNIDQIKGTIGVDATDTDNEIIKLEIRQTPYVGAGQPECVGTSGTSTMALNLNAILQGMVVSIPIAGGIKWDLIQNLKYSSIRKDLN